MIIIAPVYNKMIENYERMFDFMYQIRDKEEYMT